MTPLVYAVDIDEAVEIAADLMLEVFELRCLLRVALRDAGVEELALVMDDPDAPTDSPFVHWAVYGIGTDTATVTDGDASLTYGVNDAGTDAWFGPCPPPGDGLHTYRWKLFGLSAAMDLEAGLDGRALEAAIADTIVADSLLIASYERAT